MTSGFRRINNGMHDIQHVVSHPVVGAMLAAVGDGGGHVAHADATAVVGVAEFQRDLAPRLFASAPEQNGAAECVGIRHGQRSLRTINLNIRQAVRAHIETRGQRHHRTGFEIQYPGDVRGHIHRNGLARQRLTGDFALFVADAG